ncbi:MAG TPA: hypothetical protein VL693_12015 [Vicinamibacterales bacterium]|jgi:hypothetical protein|nr:hypothetical protein [Vicinamibacterales bacterium]
MRSTYLLHPVLCLAIAIATIAVHAQTPNRRFAPQESPIPVLPFALAQMVGELAGYPVAVQRARLLWVVDAHAVIIESDSSMSPEWRDHGRVLVLTTKERSLVIPRPPIAIAPISVVGVARTLLGVQAGHDVPWPGPLTRRVVDRLDIRAAIVADSVRTADGVELTSIAP